MNSTELKDNSSTGKGKLIFPRNINRMNYFIRRLVLFLISVVIFFNTPSDPWTLLIYLYPVVIFGLWFADIPRIRDLGWNPWIVMLGLIPNAGYVFNIVILIVPGKQLEQNIPQVSSESAPCSSPEEPSM